MDTGIGGAEEAVIHVAELLGQRGHSVSVHMPGVASGRRFGSVTYDHNDALRGATVDVAIMWRQPKLAGLPRELALRAGRTYLWLHDNLPAPLVLEYEHLYDKVIAVSAYHRNLLRELADDRVLVFTNGIDPGQFDQTHHRRDPQLIVYGSEYRRGLETLLCCWPTIREHVPDCRLHVFYGWQGLERRNPQRAEALHRKLDPLLAQPGIAHLGRIGHRTVAAQYMHAGVWAYPCWAQETSCITAMKAQAGGAVPAVIPSAALRETVRFGFRTTHGYDDIPQTSSPAALVSEWLTGLIGLLRSPAEQARIRQTMIPASKTHFDWSTVIDQWEQELTDTSDA